MGNGRAFGVADEGVGSDAFHRGDFTSHGADLSIAAQALSRGEAVVFPTDTVVGLGVSVEAADSPRVLYDIKERDEGKPIAWLVGGPQDLGRYGADVSEVAFELARRHWPGALTLIVRASDAAPRAFCSAEGTVGLRMPDHLVALDLIRMAGCPLATTSANIAGEPAPRTLDGLDARIAQRASSVVSDRLPDESDRPASGVASAVIDCTGESLRILREGAVTMADIHAAENAVAAKGEANGCSGVLREEDSFVSFDDASRIHLQWWLPCEGARVRGVVQLIHGMAEHIGRYDHFASYLVKQGFAVCGHDHIGHGRSVASSDDLGCLPPKDGARIMIVDTHEVRKMADGRFPGAPHFIFGHSMGSFVLRAYLARYGSGLAGAIVCGTGNQPLALSKAGNMLANLLAATRGPRSKSALIHNMAIGSYGKAVPNARTPHDWISTDAAVVDSYAADPLCAYQFSVGGYAALTSLTSEVVKPECAAGVPKDLPLLYVAGAEDPVGDFGKGVYAAAALMEKAGVSDVTTILYGGMRHEILNEPDRDGVYADISAWIESHGAL